MAYVASEGRNGRDFNHNMIDEEVLHLRNCQGGLGIKICGGQLKNGKFTGIFVKRIMIGGVASQDGNLQEGDQLLQVNGQQLNDVTNDQAVHILRREAQKGNVRLIISRSSESRSKFEDLFGQDLGHSSPSLSMLKQSSWKQHIESNIISIVHWNAGIAQPRFLDPNVYQPATWARSYQGIIHDLALDRKPLESIDVPLIIYDDDRATIDYVQSEKRSWIYNNGRMSPSPSHYGSLPNLEVGYPRADYQPEQGEDGMLPQALGGIEPQSTITRKIKAGLFAENRSPSLSTVDSGLPSTSPYPSPGNSENDMFNSNKVQTISITAGRGLGISIYGGSNQSRGPFVYVDEVIPGCDADLDGHLQSGDLIVSINKESFTGVTYEQARAILMRLKVKKGVSTYNVSFIHNPKDPLPLQEERRVPVTMTTEHSQENDIKEQVSALMRREKAQDELKRTSGQDTLLDELADMMSKIHSEEDISLSRTLRQRIDDYPRALPSKPSILQQSPERKHDMSKSLPSLDRVNYNHFTPDHFSTPAVNKVSQDTDRPLQHYLMQDLKDNNNNNNRFLSRTGERNRKNRSRRLSLDPNTRIRLEKLEEALEYLGYDLDEDQHLALKRRLRPDINRSIAYGDFVHVARDVLGLDATNASNPINEVSLHLAVRDMEEMERRINVPVKQRKPEDLQIVQNMSMRGRDDVARLTRERDEALREVQYLREKLKEKDRSCTQLEGDLDQIRQETLSSKKETSELRSRVQLANEAQRAARLTEQDNDLLIQKLEKEIASMRTMTGGPSQAEFNELQKRLVVLGCQLRKSEVSKRTYEVAVEKLTKFAETVHDNLAEEGRGTLGSRRSSKSGKRPKQISVDLAKEARDTVKAVKLLLEEEPLPFGWEEVYSPDGTRYYINHVTQTTSWVHPVSGVQYLPTIKEDEAPTDKRL